MKWAILSGIEGNLTAYEAGYTAAGGERSAIISGGCGRPPGR